MVENEITSTANIPISEIKRNIGIFSFEEKIEDNQHFARALKFADVEFKKELEDYILHAKETRYKSASDYMKLENYSLAIKEFEQAGDYNDSQEQIKICHEKIEAKKQRKTKIQKYKRKGNKKGNNKNIRTQNSILQYALSIINLFIREYFAWKTFCRFFFVGMFRRSSFGYYYKIEISR